MWAIDLVKAASGRSGSYVVLGRTGAFNAFQERADLVRRAPLAAIRYPPMPQIMPYKI
jgi:hypothetical protein